MRRWQAGDPAAFAELVARWQQPVARFVARLAGPERVPDLCQEVFLRVLQNGGRYRETGHFSTWLFRIALNVTRDAGRRQVRQNRDLRQSRDRKGAGADSASSRSRLCAPDELCERQELARAVEVALAELPQPLREVLALRHDQGMNFEEMARVLRTPASTLKSRFAAALSRLRRRLCELGYSPEETAP